MKELSNKELSSINGGVVTEVGCATAFLLLTPAFFLGFAGALVCAAGLAAGEA